MGIEGPKNLIEALDIPGPEDLANEVASAADYIGSQGRDNQRQIIEISPTAGDWSRFWQWKPRWRESTRAQTGRVDSGQMIEDVEYETTQNPNRTEIEIGWVGGDMGYYAFQEYGGINSYTGGKSVVVEGMRSIARSQPKTAEEAREALRGFFTNFKNIQVR